MNISSSKPPVIHDCIRVVQIRDGIVYRSVVKIACAKFWAHFSAETYHSEQVLMHFLNVEVDINQQTVTVVRLGTFVIKLRLNS
jgi:hypothetical protein